MTDVQWVIEAYALFLGALIWPRLGRSVGCKRVFLPASAFTLACACGLATPALSSPAAR